ncbi:MAG TPA: hypothetical protein VFA69_03375 [Candidatus Nitrosotalea sp.]|nr:hypothetical protein [Candidatus Nitrosotalea sp.]
MTPEENMIRLFQGLNQAYLEIAQFLTQTRTRRNQLIESGIPVTNTEVVTLQNVIGSTERQLGEIAISMRSLRGT